MPNNPSSRSGGPAGTTISDEDLIALLALAVFAGPSILLAWPRLRETTLRWLLEHRILVPATADPAWTLPGGIAGLDGPRLAVAALAAFAASACLISWMWHAYRRWIQHRLSSGDRR